MDKRLKIISTLIKDGKGFIDVGTDHAYLPVYMVQNGYKGKIFASDINSSPLDNALKSLVQNNCADKVSLLKMDGLENCPQDEIDTIVISGMGGDTICRILDLAEWCMDDRFTLILQPMTKAEVLRYWLTNNEFGIVSEHLAEENETIYQIMEVRFGIETKLSDAELFAGKNELCVDKELYRIQLDKLINRFNKAITGLQEGSPELSCRARLFGDILKELEAMRDNNGNS